MSFIVTPLNPPTASYLTATELNLWRENNMALWAQATKTWDVFTGVVGSKNGTIGNGDYTIGSWYFRYQSSNTLLLKYDSGGSSMKVYITDDLGEHLDSTTAGAQTLSKDISAYTFTAGTTYRVRFVIVHTGASSFHVDYIAALISNAYSWPTLPAWADTPTAGPTAADFATITTAQRYLNAEVPQLGSSCMVSSFADGITSVFYNAAFYVRKSSSGTMQTTLTVTYRFQNGAATMYVYDSAGVLQDTINLTVDAAEHTSTYTLTGTYTANTFARITAESNSTSAATENYIKQVTVGKVLTLTHTLAAYAHLDEVKGVSGTQRLYYLGKENLDDIRAVLRGTGSDNGFQFAAPDQSFGHFAFYLPNDVGYTLGPSCTQAQTFRYLYYLPTASGAAGTLTYGTQNVSLSDANSGLWNYYDLATITDLAPGMLLTIDAVKACYQADS